MVALILKIVFTQNAICDNLVSSPKLGHIYVSLLALKIAVTVISVLVSIRWHLV